MILLPLGPQEDDDLERGPSRPALVTYTLLGACGLVFLLTHSGILPPETLGRIVDLFGFHVAHPLGPAVLTHQFLHGNWIHLLGNGVFLFVFGVTVERRIGSLATLLVFLGAGAAGAWIYAATARPVAVVDAAGRTVRMVPPLVGASGAIMGLVGCLLPTAPSMRIRVLCGFHVWWRVVAVPAWGVALAFFSKEMLFAVLQRGAVGTAYTAHLGGIVGGALLAYLVPSFQRVEDRLVGRVREALGTPALLTSSPDALRGGPLAASLPVAASDVMDALRLGAARARAGDEDDLETMEDGLRLGEEGPEPAGRAADSGRGEDDPVPGSDASDEELPPLSEAVPVEGGDDLEGSEPVPLGESEGPAPGEARFGAVPEDQDLTQVSGIWAPSAELADLQDRFQRARKMERRTDRARVAFGFYQKVLRDDSLPPGYRAYAGARSCRMLVRARRYQKALSLARKLLKNRLTPELEEHIRASARHARRKLQVT